MKIKFSSQLFLLLLIYTCIILNVATETTYAAAITRIETNKNTISTFTPADRFHQLELEYKYQVFIEHRLKQKKLLLTQASKNTQYIKTTSSNTPLIQQHSKNIIKFTKPATQSSNASFVSNKKTTTNTINLYQQLKLSGQDFLSTNEDNAFLQDALITLENSKILLNETETSLHKLTQKIALSLDLDNYLQSNLLIPQHNYNSMSQSIQPKKRNTLNYQQNISASELPDFEHINNNLLQTILSISSLYYLSALMLFFSILKWLLKVLLTKKYKPKHVDYMYIPNQKRKN